MIRNCLYRNNAALTEGAAVYIVDAMSNIDIENTLFNDNTGSSVLYNNGMLSLRNPILVLALVLLLAPLEAPATGGPGGGDPLRILLTNDDGFDSEGITALRDALLAKGHEVVVVAPATQQSGKGGSINTNAFNFDVGVGTMMLTNHGDDVWSLAGTPSDSVKAGLDIVMADAPPDLVVSGLNEGQNIGQPGSNGSGTIGAALRAAFSGVPAIAGSVEILFSEAGDDFPSTQAAYAPGVHRFWRYRGKVATQYWRAPVTKGLAVQVNGRTTYWASQAPIPGGISYENFEFVAPFAPGQTFTFGVTPDPPQALGFGKP